MTMGPDDARRRVTDDVGGQGAADHPGTTGRAGSREAWRAAVALVTAEARGVAGVDARALLADTDPAVVAHCCAHIAARVLRASWCEVEVAAQLARLGEWAATDPDSGHRA